ncbi:MAG: serine/threonine-protein kinase, partial [Planctomycetota bacterium]|nr:serine/threonine-protein kinase [Planctomycetota bacterium]
MNEETLRLIWAKTVIEGSLDEQDPGQSYKTDRPETSSERVASPTLILTTRGREDTPSSRKLKKDAEGSDYKGQTSASDSDATVIESPPSALLQSPSAPQKDQYELIEEIGRGGMGVVFRALQQSLDREVAVKKLRATDSRGSHVETFTSEARITGLLDHPNIVPVHDLGLDRYGDVLLAMKLVGGLEWRRLLHPVKESHKVKAERYGLQEHLSILLQVCNALEYAHSKEIAHCDLKPENIMIGDFGETLVMDWGIAVHFGEKGQGLASAPHKSSIQHPRGTPLYMPPELAEGRGEDIGATTDVYLLGAILYEILEGRAPHSGSTLTRVLLAACESKTPSFSEDSPGELQNLCCRAMAKEPQDRLQSVSQFREDLISYLRHRESSSLSDEAEKTLGACQPESIDGNPSTEGSRSYSAFEDCLGTFKNALKLWSGNERASEGMHKAQIAYARSALKNNDLGLAQAQIGKLQDCDAKQALGKQLQEAHDKQRAGLKSARRIRHSLVGAIVVIFVGLIAGFLIVDEEREQALNSARLESKAREDAAFQRDLAEEKSRQAKRLAKNAESERKRAVSLLAWAYREESKAALALKNPMAARLLLTESLKIEDQIETRAALLNPELRAGQLLWQAPRALGAYQLAMSPDQQFIALTHYYGSKRIAFYDLKNKRVVQLGQSTKPVRKLVFSPDSRLIIAAFGAGLKVWSCQTQKLIHSYEGHEGSVTDLAVHPDSTQFASVAADGTCRLWSVKTGQVKRVWVTDHNLFSKVFCGFRDAGQTFFLLEGRSREFTLHDFEMDSNRKTKKSISLPRDSRDVLAMGAKGTSLYVAGNKRLYQLSLEGKRLQKTTIKQEYEHAVLSPDGHCLILWKNDQLDVLQCSNGRMTPLYKHSQLIRSVAFAGSDRFLFGDEGHLLSYDLRKSKEAPKSLSTIHGPMGRLDQIAFFQGSRAAVTHSSGRAYIWDFSGAPSLRQDFATGVSLAGTLKVSPDGRWLGILERYRRALFWRIEAGKVVDLENPIRLNGSFLDFDFSAKPNVLAVLGQAGLLTVDLNQESARHLTNISKGVYSPLGIEFVDQGNTLLVCPTKVTSLCYQVEGLRLTLKDSAEFPAAKFNTQSTFNPVARELATGGHYSKSNTVTIWDWKTGREKAKLGAYRSIHGLQYSPDGRFLAVAVKEKIDIWSVERREKFLTLSGHGADVTALAFSPDGQWLLSGALNKTLFLWQIRDPHRSLNQQWQRFTRVGQKSIVISQERTKAQLQLLELEGSSRRHSSSTISNSLSTDVALSVSGTQVAKAFPDGLYVWKYSKPVYESTTAVIDSAVLTPGKNLGHRTAIKAVAYSPSGSMIATVGFSKADARARNELIIWDSEYGKILKRFNEEGSETLSLLWSQHENAVFLLDGKGTLRMVSLDGRKTNYKLPFPTKVSARVLALHGKRELLAIGGHRMPLRVGSIASGAFNGLFESKTLLKKPRSLCWSGDGRFLMLGDESGTVTVWDIKKRAALSTIVTKTRIKELKVSEDGSLFAIKDDRQGWHFWLTKSGVSVNGGAIIGGELAFSKDGKRIALSLDRFLRVYQISGVNQRAWRRIALFSGQRSKLTGVAFSPDGQCVSTVSKDRNLRIWSLSDRRMKHFCEGFTPGVRRVIYSARGERLVTVMNDMSLRVWSLSEGLSKGRLEWTFRDHLATIEALAVSPQGDILVSVDGKK